MQNYEEPEFQNILFVPSAYNTSQRATTSKTPSSPRRFGGTTTPGQQHSRTPQPPPLNSVRPLPTLADVTQTTPMKTPTVRHTVPMSGFQDLAPSMTPEVYKRPSIRGMGSEQRWIKICGVEKDDSGLIVHHFLQCGKIEKWHPFDGTLEGNWMYIKFESEDAAVKALEFNGRLIGGMKCFGVVKPQETERNMLDEGMMKDSVETPTLLPEIIESPIPGPSQVPSPIHSSPMGQFSQRMQTEALQARTMEYNTTEKSMFGYFRRFLFG